ncbi:hypothetical protein ABEF95_012438 [Exophiala dermatitidis]
MCGVSLSVSLELSSSPNHVNPPTTFLNPADMPVHIDSDTALGSSTLGQEEDPREETSRRDRVKEVKQKERKER